MQDPIPSRIFDGVEYYTMGNAARYIGISTTGLHKLINRLKGTEEEIEVHEQGGGSRSRFIKKSDLDRYMRPRPVRAKQ
jgi:hypothetical protein